MLISFQNLLKNDDFMPMEPWDAAKSFMLISEILANGHLPGVSRKSGLSTDKCDNEMELGAVHRSSGTFLTTEEKLWKTLTMRPPKGCATNQRQKWGHLLPN